GCPTVQQWAPLASVHVAPCDYHVLVHLDKSGLIANSSCDNIGNLHAHYWFVLPSVQEYFYRRTHADYVPLPALRGDCQLQLPAQMDFIYPKNHRTTLFATRDADGAVQPVVLRIAHKNPQSELFWYVNGMFKTRTVRFHEFPFLEPAGVYDITVVDENGFEISRQIQLVL